MEPRKIRRVVNASILTPEEVGRARRLRELVEQDKPEIIAEGRRLLAAKRHRQAADRGSITLGQQIRQARESFGLSQAQLAERARVSQAYLSYLEQDQREPTLSIAARLARELGIPLDQLAAASTTV
jgi:ribosome-binding protein aMBF1 (putative translation factor)